MHSVEESIQVDSTGRRLVLTRAGTGTPAVVLETGLGADAGEWEAVFQQVKRLTSVYCYDRANRGRSDPAPRPRSAQDLVDDLHALLVNAAIPRPVVFVGHSLGGLVVRLYAHQHPHDIAGLVLVDPMHEDQFERMGPLLRPTLPDEPEALTWLRTFWTVDWRDPTKNAEGVDLLASQSQTQSIDSLGNIPMLVLTSGVFMRELPPGPAAQRLEAQLQALRQEMHREMMRQSSKASQILVETSGHFIQREQPEVIVAAVRQMLEIVQNRL
ncbi:MAG: alpha/beta hydrolase [Chloroflexi bacterium]|nr:alpha/beta hydrolase [Chloroflexota bacterium]